MLGMYMSDKSRPGIDYPDVQGWPRGFMPLPIHNGIPYPEDCVVNTFCRCKRRDALMKIAHQGEQFQNYIKSKNYVDMITKISDAFNTTFDATTLWKVHDAVHTELIHFRDVVKKQPWFNDQFHEDLEEVNRQATVFTSGLFNPPVVQGINVRREILKARGGPLVNEIAARMRTKARCAKNPAKCDKYHKNLKYHVYSAHDHTVYALLSVLGIEDVVNGKDHYGQWPNYAANILIEMFHNQTDGQAYFRVLYADNEKTVPSVVTPNIKECNSKEFCDLQVLDHIAKEFRPDRPMKEFCEMLPKSEDIVHTDDDNSAAISDIKNYLYLTVFSYLIHKHI
uniref:Acid phosphatase n=2 Tax=Caenorhabditis japonica TaxID=281687 RepID=A0A8R1IB39_CAEJA